MRCFEEQCPLVRQASYVLAHENNINDMRELDYSDTLWRTSVAVAHSLVFTLKLFIF